MPVRVNENENDKNSTHRMSSGREEAPERLLKDVGTAEGVQELY